MALQAGDVLAGRYRLLGPLGAGGMASVWLADDLPARKRRVVKVLRLDAPELVEAFRDEFALLSGLTHPCLTRVHDYGSSWVRGELVHYYAAEQVEGTTLEEAARARRQVPLEALLDAVEGLRALHAARICHGDFTPDNVLVRPDGGGVLIDLGCARPFGSRASTLSGTPDFLAPELLDGAAADPRADLFAVGRTLERAVRAARKEAPQLAPWIGRLTAVEPRERPASVDAVLEGLGRAPERGFGAIASSPRLLGREGEIERFLEWLSALRDGAPGPRVLRLAGASGAGTSRLLRELLARAELSLPVLRAAADEAEPVSWLLSTASGVTPPLAGARGALSAKQLLGSVEPPLLLALEDADRLDAAEDELLRAFVRVIDDGARFGLIVSGVEPLAGLAVETIAVPPLERAAVRQWLRGVLSERALGELFDATSGMPGAIEAELSRRATRASRDVAAEPARELSKLIASASPERLARWALLAALGGVLDPADFDLALGDFLELGPVLRRERGLVRLRSREDLPSLIRALPVQSLRAAHLRIADAWLERDVTERAPGVREAELVKHLLLAGELERAASALSRLEPVWREAPRAFARQLRELPASALNPELGLAAAEIALLAADADSALSQATRVLASKPAAELAGRARSLAAEALLRLGKPERAERALKQALARKPGRALAARYLERVARARSQRGDHAGAERAAREGLEGAPDAVTKRALSEALGVAVGYLGRTAEAEQILERVLEELGADGPARDRARVLGAQAIIAFRTGRPLVAAERHRRALELAEQSGLDDLSCVSSLNLGTALQQAGDLGGALESYQRGLSMALALGRDSTELVLRYNLANLRAEIGDFARAERELEALSLRAEAQRLLQLGPMVALLRGEIALCTEELERAERELDAAERAFRERGLDRELVEVECLRAELELSRERAEPARGRARRAAERAAELGVEDLGLRVELTLARAELATDGKAARKRLEAGLGRARALGHELLEAKFATELCRLSLSRAEPDAWSLAERARRLWDRLASNLDEAERESFWRDPRRSVLARLTQRTEPKHRAGEPEVLRRLLSLSRRVNSSLSIERVLDYAVDAAVELTGAERGFLLLAEPGAGPRVAASRAGLDPERGPSLGVVERVLGSQEAVLTTDAAADARFSAQRSVHALRLKSVLAVPISTPERLLGVVYVDSRVQRSRFTESERELLVALSDPIAVALSNARLHFELEQRTRELEEQKRTVERLSAQKDRELRTLREELRAKERALELRYDYSQIIGRGPKMRAVLEQLDRVMDAGVNLLVLGESGTGKELVARALHVNGPRKSGAFVGLNCAALPETLLESELFGHARGAFTGADRDRKGLLLEADGGTLFLDEIGEMPLPTQAKLLRVLQEREVRPLGSTKTQPFDVRLVCATHRDLEAEVAAGRFREDLYYRVAVVVVRLPPLRERLEDLPELVKALLARIAQTAGRAPPELGRDALRALSLHPFPGNVRELENVLTRAVVMSSGKRIEAADLELVTRAAPARTSSTRLEFEREERERILEALRETRWNVSVVSRRLKIPRNTLYRKLERYGLSRTE